MSCIVYTLVHLAIRLSFLRLGRDIFHDFFYRLEFTFLFLFSVPPFYRKLQTETLVTVTWLRSNVPIVPFGRKLINPNLKKITEDYGSHVSISPDGNQAGD